VEVEYKITTLATCELIQFDIKFMHFYQVLRAEVGAIEKEGLA